MSDVIDWDAVKRKALALRRDGLSYEAIADELSGERIRITPWGVYSWCNPKKNADQIATWKRRQYGAEGARWITASG